MPSREIPGSRNDKMKMNEKASSVFPASSTAKRFCPEPRMSRNNKGAGEPVAERRRVEMEDLLEDAAAEILERG